MARRLLERFSEITMLIGISELLLLQAGPDPVVKKLCQVVYEEVRGS